MFIDALGFLSLGFKPGVREEPEIAELLERGLAVCPNCGVCDPRVVLVENRPHATAPITGLWCNACGMGWKKPESSESTTVSVETKTG